jgi:acetolactate synthase-1/2/3 large subunit
VGRSTFHCLARCWPHRRNPPPASAGQWLRRHRVRNEAGIAEAARLLAAAKNPLIIAGNTGRDTAAVGLLAELAMRFALPVVQNRARHLALPSSHPMHLGYESGPHLGEADVVIVLECDVPWVPKAVRLKPECRVVHVGFDPLFGGIPIRGFPCDLALSGSTTAFLRDLAAALSPLADAQTIEDRRKSVTKRHEKMHAGLVAEVARVKNLRAIHPAWVSHCIAEAKGDDTIVVNEYTLMAEHCRFERPGTYFGSSSASGLGWGMGAALGAKLAAPDKLVIAKLGDGAYIFANPVAGHYASRQNNLPILTIVFNNGMWNGAAFNLDGLSKRFRRKVELAGAERAQRAASVRASLRCGRRLRRTSRGPR